MLEEIIEEQGIDPDEIAETAVIPDQRCSALYKLSHDFTIQTNRFLRESKHLINNETRAYFEDLQWHHTVIPAKIYRALSSDSESLTDDQSRRIHDEDAVNSAAVAIKSLTICIMAFDYIAYRYQECPQLKEQCNRLSVFASAIKEQTRKKFI